MNFEEIIDRKEGKKQRKIRRNSQRNSEKIGEYEHMKVQERAAQRGSNRQFKFFQKVRKGQNKHVTIEFWRR